MGSGAEKESAAAGERSGAAAAVFMALVDAWRRPARATQASRWPSAFLSSIAQKTIVLFAVVGAAWFVRCVCARAVPKKESARYLYFLFGTPHTALLAMAEQQESNSGVLLVDPPRARADEIATDYSPDASRAIVIDHGM